ncbi:MAG: hypothetical protein ABI644_03075 [Arenimonas sp.]
MHRILIFSFKLFVRAFLAFLLLLTVLSIIYWAPDRPVSELKERWAAPPSQFISIEDMSVHVRDEGPRDDPTPLLLLHGTSSSSHTWEAG